MFIGLFGKIKQWVIITWPMAPLVLVVTPTMVKSWSLYGKVRLTAAVGSCRVLWQPVHPPPLFYPVLHCLHHSVGVPPTILWWFCWQVHRLQKDFSVLLENSVYLFGRHQLLFDQNQFFYARNHAHDPKSLSVNIAWSLNISEVL